MQDHTTQAHELRRPVYGAVAAALFTIGLKTSAYWLTGSVGLFSDAAESGVNLLASLTALASLWYASRPADADHTYGHEKIVYFSSGLEGLLIAIAGLGTAVYATERLIRPQPLDKLGLGAAIALVASMANLGVARWLIAEGRRHRSLVLEADGRHLMTDVWTSVGVVVGIALAGLTGWTVIDPILGLVLAGLILITAYRLVARSFNGLMDRALPDADRVIVRQTIEANLPPGCVYHALRTREAGSHRFVDFHLLVPGSMSVRQAHDFADRIEAALEAALSPLEATIHVEPVEDPQSWRDSELIDVEERERKTQGDTVT